MPTLTDEIKAFIVTGLAQYDTPAEVAAAVKANFGVEVSRQQVHSYDPAGSQPPTQRWRDLYAATRRAFLQDAAEIAIAQKAFRLRILDRMLHRVLGQNARLTAALLEQAAKECGGIYERRAPSVLMLPAALQHALPAALPVALPPGPDDRLGTSAEVSGRLDRCLPAPHQPPQPGQAGDEQRE
ncbi:MAG TPA: DUF2280 domain-containing protein [Candidatus Cybelea sp.]|nr:DUF2280 domain-containing protein [Candidatus Cybelea sp.]